MSEGAKKAQGGTQREARNGTVGENAQHPETLGSIPRTMKEKGRGWEHKSKDYLKILTVVV